MTRKAELGRLAQISGLMLDLRLGRLSAAARARQQSEDQLAGLARPPVIPADLPDMAANLVALTFQRWADARRLDLNLALARQTADWIEARDAAREAFGRAEAVKDLHDRFAKGRP